MNKELFVSATPHETKVGITEDDQLAEIYLERENEYTLAGSIYKGRVTRVLPGMQSAFVDIGLERDAFLYVSDFMDLEHQDEDLDEAIPASRPVNGSASPNGTEALSAPDAQTAGEGSRAAATEADGSAESGRGTGPGRDYRGRRRRRGRRGETGRGDRNGESRFDTRNDTSSENDSEPRSESSRAEGRNDRHGRGERHGRGNMEARFQRTSSAFRPGRDYDYGPPPGYQPIVLPGESISKYQRQSVAQDLAPGELSPGGANQTEGGGGHSERQSEWSALSEGTAAAVTGSFPEDEPMFASNAAEPLHEEHDHAPEVEREEEIYGASEGTNAEILHMDRADESFPANEGDRKSAQEHPSLSGGRGAVEEQEIEEEEVELQPYGEDDDEDDFEEMEEESQAASEPSRLVAGEAALSSATGSTVIEEVVEEESEAEAAAGTEGMAPSEAEVEAQEREEQELEVEEAQAEAEALLEAEAIGDGTVDASAAVRGPAPEARLLQRAQRRPERGFDRGRGRRGGGGRRFRSRENRVVPQISELLKEGQEILIQIAKEPIAKKGARITSHIALPGRFLVFMPTVNHTGVSRKISSEEERQRLKRIIQSERENGSGGFIVRTAAAGATDEELRADIRFLKNLWTEIKTRSENSQSPALIYHDLNVVERVLRDQVSSDFSAIWVDNEQEYERILRFANRFQPGLVKRVKLYTKETPLFDQFGLNEEVNKALKSKVWLKSGGYIVINQTEALVAIDVNTGKYVGKTARLEDTIVKTNVDAIKEIVRQVRLRDLGGIIIIDFIDMDERRNRQKVMQALEEALRLDRAPSKVLQFNDFGLVAITRKRVKQSLERTIGSPCPYCQSTGFVKSVGTVCNEVYVEMRKISNHLEHNDVMLRVNPEVAKALKAGNAKLLNEMEEMTKKTIIVKSDPSLHQEQFDIH
jgi:Rne/Rng family ribonuclease